MYGILLYYILGFKLFIFGCSAADYSANYSANYVDPSSIVKFFEYGSHVSGEELSFSVDDLIPSLVPYYSINVEPVNPEFEQRYSYLRVEYVSPLSRVHINFNPDTFLLSFNISFPFMSIPYGVDGYSLKRTRSRVWSTWRKSRGSQYFYLKGHP